MKIATIAVASLLFILPAGKAFSWGQEGHSIVGEIAQRHLDATAAEKIRKLFGEDVSLASLSNWADDIKTPRPATYNWHFVDIPLAEQHYAEGRDCKPSSAGDCVIAEIERATATLKDTTATPIDRQEALKFLVHFVGDLHQPLHTVLEGRGENDLKVTYFIDPYRNKTEKTDLHKVWDSGLIHSVYWNWGTYVDDLETKWLPGRDVKALQAGTPVAWAEATHLAAQQVTQPVHMNDVLGEDYLKMAKPVMDEQLALAGLRLAAIINEALK